MNWEDGLGAFASTAQTEITPRSKVTGDPWLTSHNVKMVDGHDPGADSDLWWAYNFDVTITYSTNRGGTTSSTQSHAIVVSANLPWSKLNDSSGPLYKFVHDPANVLEPLVGTPGQNDTTSVWSFDAAANMLTQVDTWLTGWTPRIRAWANDLESEASDWQGSAASEFKAVLNAFANEFENLHVQLNTPSSFASSIQNSRSQLLNTTVALYNAYSAWRAGALAWPLNALDQAFKAVMGTATITLDQNPGGSVRGFTINTSLGDPKSGDFWDQLQTQAKKLWTDNIASMLDAPAGSALSALDSSYLSTTQVLPASLVPLQLRLPSSAQTTDPNSLLNDPKLNTSLTQPNSVTSTNSDLSPSTVTSGTGTDSPLKNLTSTGTGISSDSSPITGVSGSSADPTSTLGPVAANKSLTSGLPDSASTSTSAPTSSITGTGTSSNSPLSVPAGSTVGDDGSVVGPDGQPVLDSAGNPVVVPQGSMITPTGTVMDALGNPVSSSGSGSPSLGASTPLTVPPGSMVADDGSVLGPDGKPVLDGAGNPITVPQGSTITPTGTVMDPDGNPVADPSSTLSSLPQAGSLTVPSGSHVTGNGSVVGPDGKPVLDGAGNPITVPQGSTITPTGTVMDPDGNPVADPSSMLSSLPQIGSPTVPTSSTVTPTGTVTGSGGSTIPDVSSTLSSLPQAGSLTVPSGSHVTGNGSVVGPNGQPVLDGAGHPITVPKGSTITPTGTVMDANGHPIPGAGSGTSLVNSGPPLVGSQPPKLSHLATLASSGLPHSSVSGAPSLSGGQGGPALGANPLSQWTGTGTSTGMSRQALASGGNPAANDQAVAAAQKEAAAREAAMSAAEESQMMGRSVATSSGEPMMPPPMGGMPAGGGSGGKRPRTVFEPQDEEVWGTESHAVDGVIGR